MFACVGGYSEACPRLRLNLYCLLDQLCIALVSHQIVSGGAAKPCTATSALRRSNVFINNVFSERCCLSVIQTGRSYAPLRLEVAREMGLHVP